MSPALAPLVPALIILLALAGAAQSASTQTPPPKPNAERELDALTDTERAFAAASVAKGMRAAFLQYFAPEGINFTPHPVNTRESLSARPAPPGKPPITLDWWPVHGDISAAGDLGFTTGPFALTDSRENNKVVGHGWYFSVWKKPPDGTWRVAADYGVETPAPGVNKADAQFRPSPWTGTPPKLIRPATRDAVLARELAFAEASLRGGTINAYRSFTSWDNATRLYRDQMDIMIGRAAIQKGLGGLSEKLTWQPLASEVASSGELAFTYGKWENPARANRSGYYLRVWRQVRGEWRVVAEVMNPLK